MAIITISRGSYSRGKEVAERVAEKLGYECISRDILLEASEQFNMPAIKLVRALHDAPSVLERFSYGRIKYIAFIRASLLKHVQKDNVVYHGLAGQYFFKGVSHVLKVRIIADLEDRVKEEMKRENISAEEARKILEKDDEERRKWGLHLYGTDTHDPSLFDMTLHIRKLTIDDAVDIILHTIALPHFQATPESQQALDNLCLAAQVEAALVNVYPNVTAVADKGTVTITTVGPLEATDKISKKIKELGQEVPGVKDMRVDVKEASWV